LGTFGDANRSKGAWDPGRERICNEFGTDAAGVQMRGELVAGSEAGNFNRNDGR